MSRLNERAMHGLLSGLNPTGTPHSVLATDGGGAGHATDAGGTIKRLSGVQMEAVRTSAAALRRAADQKAIDNEVDHIRRRDKKDEFRRWESAVRIEIVKSRLLGDLIVDAKGTLTSAAAGSALLTLDDPLSVEEPAGKSDADDTPASGETCKWLLKEEARHVLRRAVEREERQAEILVQTVDLWPFYQSLTHLELDETPRTHELLRMAMGLATGVVMQIKDAFACPRPSDVLPSIGPVIPVPGHPSFPSGHATSAYLVSELLIKLLKCGTARRGRKLLAQQLRRLAFRISRNREVAGVHFGIDSLAGQMLGTTLADYMSAAADPQGGNVSAGSLTLRKLANDAPGRKTLRDLARRDDELDMVGVAQAFPTLVTWPVQKVNVAPVSRLVLMWQAAEKELKDSGLQFS